MYIADYKKLVRASDGNVYYDIAYSLEPNHKYRDPPTNPLPILKAIMTDSNRLFMEIWGVIDGTGSMYIFTGTHSSFASVIPNLVPLSINMQIEEIIKASRYPDNALDFFYNMSSKDIIELSEKNRRRLVTTAQLLFTKQYPELDTFNYWGNLNE
tara:strand:- start:1319 stop:1783 length:465 start_codon:yes stop_codon:yes gene_type:complete